MELAELIKLLRCPESHQGLRLADATLLQRLNSAIAAGSIRNRGGRALSSAFDGGLVRDDGKLIYPLRGKLPIMLIDEAVELGDGKVGS